MYNATLNDCMNKWQHHIYLRIKNINNWHISVNIGLKGVKKEDQNKFLKKYKKKTLKNVYKDSQFWKKMPTSPAILAVYVCTSSSSPTLKFAII